MTLIDQIEASREAHLEELKEFLRIPSVSTKSEHKSDIEKAARWVAEKLRGAIIASRTNPKYDSVVYRIPFLRKNP